MADFNEPVLIGNGVRASNHVQDEGPGVVLEVFLAVACSGPDLSPVELFLGVDAAHYVFVSS